MLLTCFYLIVVLWYIFQWREGESTGVPPDSRMSPGINPFISRDELRLVGGEKIHATTTVQLSTFRNLTPLPALHFRRNVPGWTNFRLGTRLPTLMTKKLKSLRECTVALVELEDIPERQLDN